MQNASIEVANFVSIPGKSVSRRSQTNSGWLCNTLLPLRKGFAERDCIRMCFSATCVVSFTFPKNRAFRVNHALFVSQCFNCIGDAPQMFPSLQTLGKETADFYCDSLFFFLFFCFFFFCFLCLLLLLLFTLFLCFLLLTVLVIVVLVMVFIPVVAVGDVLHVLSLV